MGEGQHGVNENMLPKTPGEESDAETSAKRLESEVFPNLVSGMAG